MSPVTHEVYDGDTLACQLLQKEEYEVLESIYPEVVSHDSDGVLKLEIPVELGGLREISVVRGVAPITSGDNHDVPIQMLSLSNLPPLLLHVILPPSYPLRSSPTIMSIRATHMWLPRLSDLRNILLKMWKAEEGVLYSWVEFLRSGEFLVSMGLTNNVDDHIKIPHPAPRPLALLLLNHESSALSSQFAQNTYSCSICLTTYKGAKCLRLSCDHVFCRSCLEDFWRLCIMEGDVGRVGCPDPECVKAVREANEDEVARIVTEDEVKRWNWLREKRSIEKDPTIVHCPMTFCQRPVPKPDSRESEESGWARLRICGACSYSFCSFCRRTWHGPVSGCPISFSETLVLNYLALPDDSPARQATEQRYGKSNVLKLVAAYKEEQSNRRWLETSTMACPGCQVHVEKSLGCNHMTCFKCKQHFCYRCGGKVDSKNPYSHYLIKGHSCHGMLFDSRPEDDEWEQIGV